MKMYQRTLEGKLNRYDRTVHLTINSTDQKNLRDAWDKFFFELLSAIEFSVNSVDQIPTHVELFLANTYETTRNEPNDAHGNQDLDELSKELLSIITAVCQILCKFVGPAPWVGIEIFLNFKLRTTA